MSLWTKHAIFEKNSIVLLIGVLIVIAIGGLVEIVPLFYLESTIEKVEGMRPYTPLELAGRDIYVREGCYICHCQMIRPLRDEVERYGHYSLAAESMYDHPFQWGSKRTGPDLARVGGKYSDDWHARSSERPARGGAGIDHAGLSLARATTELDFAHIADDLKVQRARSACPTRDEMIANARGRPRGPGRSPTRDADGAREALPEGAGARLRRQSRARHRAGRAGRLPADARHAGRLQALRRQSQHPLRQTMTATYRDARRVRPDLGPRLLRRRCSSSCSSTRCGRRASSSSTRPRACRCGRTDRWPHDDKHDSRRASPAPRPPATNGTASRSSTRRCRAGGCGCSTPPSSGRSATGSSIRPGRWSPAYTTGVLGWTRAAPSCDDLAALKALRGADDGQARRGLARARSRPIRSC